jgi:hypothetical protein
VSKSRHTNTASLVLCGLAISLTLLRFASLRMAPFIADEPVFQMLVDDHIHARTLPTHALQGSKGVDYGPSALWMYLPLRLVTSNVYCIFALHIFYHCTGLVLLFLAIRRSVGATAAWWTWLIVAASPYLFFYARLPWDNTFLVLFTGMLLYFLSILATRPASFLGWLGLGLSCALVFNLHLMSVPVLVAALAMAPGLISRAPKRGRALLAAFVGAAAMGATMFPYLRVIADQLAGSSPFKITTEALTHALPEAFLGTKVHLTFAGMNYFFEQAFPHVVGELGPLAWFGHLGWFVAILGWGCIVITLGGIALRWIRRSGPSMSRLPIVVRFGLAYFLILLLYFYGVRPYPLHPHYFMSAYWLLPFFAVWAIGKFRRGLQWAARGVVGVMLFANIAFVFVAHRHVSANHGTRGLRYSSISEETREAIRSICAVAKEVGNPKVSVDLSPVPGVRSAPFEWFARHLPECERIVLSFSQDAAPARSGELAFQIVYPGTCEYDARLRARLR